LIYYKAGFDPSDYPTENEWNARKILELSNAIKAPNIQHHLCCTKKIQQSLSEEGAVERFLKNPGEAQAIRNTFKKQYVYKNVNIINK
jgi:glutathione synthase